MRNKTLVAILAAAALAAFSAGCARREVRPAVIQYQSADPRSLVAAYNANAERIATLSAQLNITLYYYRDEKPGSRYLEAWFDVEKPSRLRLRHTSIGREMFYVVMNGSRYWVGLDNSLSGETGVHEGRDVVYTGTVGENGGGAARETVFLRPDRLMAAFSLTPMPPKEAAAVTAREYPERYEIQFLERPGPGAQDIAPGVETLRLVAIATFDRTNLRLSRYQVFDEGGRLALDVTYKSYARVGDIFVPDALEIRWPADRLTIDAKVTDIKVGVPMPEQLWQFKWRPDADVIQLDGGR